MQVQQLENQTHLNTFREHDVRRCAIYIRVSTAMQRMEGWSLDAQRAGLTATAKAKGWKVVDVYADEGKSARKRLKDRREIRRLIEDVKAGQIDVILFKDLDRWFRNISDFYRVQDVLDEYGVIWYSQQQPGLNMHTKEGRLQVNVLLSVGQNETDATSDRIKYTNKYLIQQRRWPTGGQNLPRGYTLDEDNHVVINPESEPFVRELLDGVMRYGSVSRALQEVNARRPDELMRYNNALRLLKNPLLCGEYEGVLDFVEEPYLTREEWELLQSRIRTNSPNRKSHFYIFSKLVRCSCGRIMVGNYTAKPNKLYRYYRCNNAIRKETCTDSHRFGEERLERELLDYVEAAIADRIAEVKAIQHARTQKSPKKSNRASIEKQLDKLEDLYIASDRMTKEKYEERRAAILAKLVEDGPEEKLPELADLEKIKAIFEGGVKEAYYTFTLEERREFWLGIIKEIRLYNGQIVGVEFVE